MTDSEIEKYLTDIKNSELYVFKENFKDDKESLIYRKHITYLINELKLIRQPFNNATVLELTELGNRVINKGGWIEYKRIESEKINRSDKKDKFDFKVSKFKYHTFWWFFAFALVGFGLSIYNFIDNNSPSENIEKQEERIEKLESELEKIQTTISNKKNPDSLQVN